MSRPHGREEPNRGYARRDDDWDRDRDDRPRGPDHFPSRGGRGGRPFNRPYRSGPGPNGPRSRTPSPRRFERERDPRDSFQSDPRRSYGPGTGGPPRGDRRYRDYSPSWDGPPRRASPPSHTRTNSPPRGPRQPVPTSSYTPTPRLPSGPRMPPAGQGRENRPFSRDRLGSGGPGPSTIANQNQSTLNVIPPRAPRSMRGSSSPVETRNGSWHNNGSSSVPSRHIELPTDIKPDIPVDGADLDLEEGEVVSPVRKPIDPPPLASGQIPRAGDRWVPSPQLPPRRRTSLSPRKQPFRSRPVSPVFRDRDRPLERDRGWGSNRRTLSPSLSRPESRDRPSSRGQGRGWSASNDRIPSGNGPADIKTPGSPEKAAPLPRPSTPATAPTIPLDPAPITSPPMRPNTPLLPEPPRAELSTGKSPLEQTVALPADRPSTPELPPPPTAASHLNVEVENTIVLNSSPPGDLVSNAVIETVVVQDTPTTGVQPSPSVAEPGNLPALSELVAEPTALPAPSPQLAEATPLPSLNDPVAVEQVAAESPALGLETGRDSARNTPPVLVHRLPPITTGPTPPESAPAMTPRIEERRSTPRMRFADLASDIKQDDVEQKNRTRTTSTPIDESPDVFGNDTATTVVNGTVGIVGSRTPNTVTIAERRAVNLPPNVVPPPRTHAGNRMRKSFPAESTITGQASPRTEASSAAPSEISEEERALRVAAAVKFAQRDHATFGPLLEDQIKLVNAETLRTAPRSNRSSPETNDVDLVQKVSESMHAQDTSRALLETRLRSEVRKREHRLAKLRSEYEKHEQRWVDNHRILDAQMADRPPMPTRIYEMILFIKEAEELAIIDETSRNRNRQATQAQLEAVIEASRLDDELHPNRLADTNGIEVPDMIPREERRCVYDDDNDLVEDPLEFYDFEGNNEAIWTEAEKAIFAKIFPNCNKQFGKIADKLPGKSVGDCVLYYYRTKKDLEWKREPAKGTLAAKKVAKSSVKRVTKLVDDEPLPSPSSVGLAATISRGGAVGGRGRGRGRASGVSTPGDKQGRRKVSAIDSLVEGQSSETTSRAASETPGAAKGKVRVPKSKRPRESSILDSTGNQPTTLDESAETPTTENPDSELPPQAKRAGKRRKVLGPDGQPIEGEEKGDKRRRPGQNSYWNNEEKTAFTKFSAMFPGDFARIAHELGNTKTVKQVENWNAKIAGEEKDTKQGVPVSVPVPVPHAAGALDFYSSHEGKQQQPRLGTFPSSQQSGPSNPTRPGGMRISALLNDDGPEVKPDHTDAASDGTVEDDRPSSRNTGRLPVASYDRPQDRYTARPYEGPQRIYDPPARYPPLQQPPPPSHQPHQPHQPHNSMGRPPRPLPPRTWQAPPPNSHPHYTQHPQPPPLNQHHYPHMRPTQPPPMGLFGHPSPSYTGQIRTIYSGSTERERANPPKDKNRSEGPAFMGYPQDRQEPPPPAT